MTTTQDISKKGSTASRTALSAPGRGVFLAAGGLVVVCLGLALHAGVIRFAQTTINGFASGVMIALAAVGVSLVYGVMKMTNIAQADFLSVGAFMGIFVVSGLGLPLWVAFIAGTLGGAVLGGLSELLIWRPLRRSGGGFYQMLLMSLGLAFVIRYALVLLATNKPRGLGMDVTTTVNLGQLYLGRTQLVVAIVGIAVLAAFGIALRLTVVGKRTRALSDDFDLAETSGINANAIILLTWCLAGALSGLAGVLYTASVGQVTPYVGSSLLLAIFAAVIVGGLGNPYGALVGGIVIGVAQEWSTLLVDGRWKFAVGFVVLTAVLVLKPEGVLTRASRRG